CDIADSALSGGASLPTTHASSTDAHGPITMNGLVTYATRPSGRMKNNERLSTLYLASYAPYDRPTFEPGSLAKTTGKASSRAHDASAVSGSTLMPMTVTLRPLLKSVAY